MTDRSHACQLKWASAREDAVAFLGNCRAQRRAQLDEAEKHLYVLCTRVFFDRMTPAEALEAWRAKGSTRVECRTDDESISLDLQ